MTQFYSLKVADKQVNTGDSLNIFLEIPKELKSVFSFQPGQCVMIEVTINGEQIRRYYSIYSSVYDPYIKIGIKFNKLDDYAIFFVKELQRGHFLKVSAPIDDVPFSLENNQNNKYLGICVGSGITPFYSIIQSLVAKKSSSKFVLVYGNKSPIDTMFYDELKQLMQKYPENLQVYFVYSQDGNGNYKGRIDTKLLSKMLAKEGTNFDAVFMIGPDELKKNAAKILETKGVDPKKMYYKVYS